MRLHRRGETAESGVFEDMADVGVVFGELQAGEDLVDFRRDRLTVVEDDNVLKTTGLVGLCCGGGESCGEGDRESED